MGGEESAMTKITQKREIRGLALLLAGTYMVSYITRINYGAVISEMEAATAFPRELLSMALTGSFITYGTGQVASGILGDRISPKRLISIGLVATVLMNLLIPICSDPYQMLAVWCVNGFAQSFMWPPLVRLMTELLPEDAYKDVSTKVSWGSSVGTILVYLLAPVIISVWSWKGVFLLSAAFGIGMLLIWNRCARDVETKKRQTAAKNKGTVSVFFTPLVVGIMVAIALQGMLRDGVTTWMPTYISETYQLSTVISILTGVILPVFSIFSVQVSANIYCRKLTNPLACAAAFFGTGALAAVGLYLLTSENAAVSVFLTAILTGCMHGVNLMLITMLPPFFKRYDAVATASGVLNACTYVGSAASTYGIAVLSANIGWQSTILVWFGIAAAGTVLCLLCIRGWMRKFMT